MARALHERRLTGAAVTDSSGDTTVPANNYFRRQLYNAILWAAGADSTGVVSVRGADKNLLKFSDMARLSFSGNVLSVSVLRDGPHTVEIAGVDGKRVAVRRGAARGDHAFTNLSAGVHIVRVMTNTDKLSRRILVP